MKKEKLLYAAGTGTQLDKINETLDSGWEMVQIQSTQDGCFVWVRETEQQLTTGEQQIFKMCLGDSGGPNTLNKILAEGWVVVDMHQAVTQDEGSYAIFVLEKKSGE